MATVHHPSDLFPVHSIPITRPFIWLGRAWDDLRHSPAASLAYGWIVATLGALILAYSRHPLYIAVAVAFVALACTVFAVSVVTVPMMVDRHVDAGTAMRISLRVAARDWPAMLVWSALIVGLVLVGFVTWLLGMVIVLPLLGHATWHAYRDIIEEA